ncbi:MULTISPECIES: hypothetical protein [Leifsonia]|uniref:Uncharacterized protein n=3 Tax=Leifsonia TaxID=110932 RepID=U2QUD2_LEIAQ|nr:MULTISPECIES: hypothetical protein [Leifsonia]ERK66520.1 hypothetical protein N136_04731 [Leifsonia aquatica ATCC 14665]MBB2967299.1 hypothetical protein [Leifsonia aquatica]NYK09538.1 hypothetical protein [Leifsonia naganoensis]
MNWWVVGVVVALVAVIVVAVKLGWIDLSNKAQRGSGTMSGAIGGSFDEIFAPTRHEAQQELDRQSFLPAPAPLPGDGEKGVWEGGKITIDVGSQGNGQRAEGRAVDDDGRATAVAGRRTRGAR